MRYYGWYSNKTLGQRAQRPAPATAAAAIPVRWPTVRVARKRWAALIKQVYEADPMCCPKSGGEIKVSLIERHQTDVPAGRQVEKILRHCGLWDEPSARAPPSAKISVTG